MESQGNIIQDLIALHRELGAGLWISASILLFLAISLAALFYRGVIRPIVNGVSGMKIKSIKMAGWELEDSSARMMGRKITNHRLRYHALFGRLTSIKLYTVESLKLDNPVKTDMVRLALGMLCNSFRDSFREIIKGDDGQEFEYKGDVSILLMTALNNALNQLNRELEQRSFPLQFIEMFNVWFDKFEVTIYENLIYLQGSDLYDTPGQKVFAMFDHFMGTLPMFLASTEKELYTMNGLMDNDYWNGKRIGDYYVEDGNE